MTPLSGSILGKFLTENIALFQLIYGANSDLSVSNLAPISDSSAGHMLKIIVIKKDTLQVVDDHIDGSIGGVPDPFVVGALGCPDSYQYEGLLKIWQTGLAFLGDGIVDHFDPVLLHIAGLFLPRRQRFRPLKSQYLRAILKRKSQIKSTTRLHLHILYVILNNERKLALLRAGKRHV